jgi:transcriptional regulator with XRE-family HTH domain
MTLGTKIQRLRNKNSLSQEELAAQLNVSRQAVSKWELGESMPETENVVQLSKLFGVSTDYLLNDEFESSMDISTVNMSGENLKPEYRHSTFTRTAYFLLAIGLFGVLTLWILSSVIPANKLILDPNPIRQDVQPADGEQMGDREVVPPSYRPIEVTGDLIAFLRTYHFQALFALCVISAVIGTFLLSFGALKKRKRSQKPPRDR